MQASARVPTRHAGVRAPHLAVTQCKVILALTLRPPSPGARYGTIAADGRTASPGGFRQESPGLHLRFRRHHLAHPLRLDGRDGAHDGGDPARSRRPGNPRKNCARVVEDFVWRLTGKQTIYQMIELADQIRDARRPAARSAGIQEDVPGPPARAHPPPPGGASSRQGLARKIPGSRRAGAAAKRCARAGSTLYLASGTDQEYMREEAGLLDVARYFDGGVYGALDDYRSFSKQHPHRADPRHARHARRRVSGLRRRLRGDRERQGKWAAWPSGSPPPSRNARWWTNGSASAWPAWARTSSSPIFSAASELLATLFRQWPVNISSSTARGCGSGRWPSARTICTWTTGWRSTRLRCAYAHPQLAGRGRAHRWQREARRGAHPHDGRARAARRASTARSSTWWSAACSITSP